MPLKHTLTPWMVTDGHYVDSRVKPGTLQEVAYCGDCETGEREANARHIVKCVNSHDRLVKALRVALELADDHPSMPSTGHIHAILDELENNQ